MTTARKRWWRAAAIAAVGGVAVTGGWLGFVRAKGQPAKPDEPLSEAANWTRAAAPAPPTVTAELTHAPEPAPPTGPVTPAGATLPPLPMAGGGVAPAIPVAQPLPVPPAPVAVPAVPAFPAIPPVEPVGAGPRVPDVALTGGDKSALPAVPPVPALPPADFPVLPTPPKTPEVKPVAPIDMQPKLPTPPAGVSPMPAVPVVPTLPGGGAPIVPPLPTSTAEPPKASAPVPPAPPVGVVPMDRVPPLPGANLLPQPTPLAPSAPPVKPADPVQPAPPVKPNSDLKPTNPGNTLNPTVAPAVPVVPVAPGGGRDVPAVPVDRPKPVETPLGNSDKYVFPVPVVPDTRVPHQRDDTMLNLTTTAAFAVLGGAMLAVEKANFPPPVPVAPMAVGVAPAVPLAAQDKTEVERLRDDLKIANKKIEDLDKQVKRLTELLTGKKDDIGVLVNPNDPGAVEEIKRLKDKIATLEGSLKAMKEQTALRPALPEIKPKGIVKVVNEYPVEISMVVNEKSYRIAPGTKLEIEVPAGDFTYQLLQSGAAPTRSAIKDKETVTLRIK